MLGFARFARFVRLAALFAVLLAFAFGVEFFWSMGQLRRIESQFVGRCTAVEGIAGAEDLTIDPKSRIAYVSAYDRAAEARGAPAKAALYSYDLNARKPELRNLTPDAAPTFRPHGLSLWSNPAKDGRSLLFVINHPEERHEVQIYEIGPTGLSLRKTIVDPLIAHPNDLVAVGPDRFYVTNDLSRDFDTLGGKLEVLLRLPASGVVYYDGASARQVADHIAYPNGINVSPDGSRVYVASLMMRQINVYERDAQSGELTAREIINVDGSPDNVEIDADGNLWVATHPQLVTLFLHARSVAGRSSPVLWTLVSLVAPPATRGRTLVAPSQILRIRARPPEECRPTSSLLNRVVGTLGVERHVSSCYSTAAVYRNRGEEISGASAAAVQGNRMLIGSIFDDRILDCRPEASGGWG